MPVNNRYNRPFTTMPRTPSAIAAITSSRNKTSIRSSAQPSCSPAGNRRSPPAPGSRRTLLCSSLVVKLASGQMPDRRRYPNGTNLVRKVAGVGLSAWELACHAPLTTVFAAQRLFALSLLPATDRLRPWPSGTQRACCTYKTIWMQTTGAVLEVPIWIVSRWAGHSDSAFTQKTHVHASEEDLHRGQAALARIHKIA